MRSQGHKWMSRNLFGIIKTHTAVRLIPKRLGNQKICRRNMVFFQNRKGKWYERFISVIKGNHHFSSSWFFDSHFDLKQFIERNRVKSHQGQKLHLSFEMQTS